MERVCVLCGKKYETDGLQTQEPCPRCRMEKWAVPCAPSAEFFLRAFALGAAYADPKHAGVSVSALGTSIFSKDELPLLAALVDPDAIREAKDKLGLVSNTNEPLLGLVLERLMIAAARKKQEDFAMECVDKSKLLTPAEFSEWFKKYGVFK
jgi:hypothetical protein